MEAATATPTAEEIKEQATNALGLQSDEERGPTRVRSADALKSRAIHKDFVLPSGAIVDLKLPNLSLMVKKGVIPNDLVDAALEAQPNRGDEEKLTREDILTNWEYTVFIIPHALASPEITSEDVEELDPFDIEMLMNVIARRLDTDAVGRQLGGLDTQESFRNFRAEQSLRAALGGM